MGHQRKLPKLLGVLQQLQARMTGRGMDEAVAKQIIEDLLSFANYGFPESHAWSFALIAYATAYLKAHHPAEFYLGMLNAWPMGFYSPATLVHDARRNGVTVLPPCLKHGEWDCSTEREQGAGNTEQWFSAGRSLAPKTQAEPLPEDASIAAATVGAGCPLFSVPYSLRIGWRHIRGLGEAARQALRDAHAEAPFQSVEDVVLRAKLGRAEALHLARAGAFEAFEPGRRAAAWEALRAVGDTLPLAPAPRLPFRAEELEGVERIFLDYLATGISTGGHPMEHLRPRLRAAGIRGSLELEEAANRSTVAVAGLVVARQHPSTSKGTVFVLLEDEGGFINVIVPPALYKENRETVRFSPFLLVEGKLERDGRLINVVGRRFRTLKLPKIASTSHDFH
jgi:error-prone DNA polymerase